MTTQQPEALRLANILRGIDARSLFANEKLSAASAALENQHARITELEAQLAQRFDAADVATAAQPAAPARDLAAVIKGAADKLDAAVRCHPNAVDTLIHEALEILDGDREPDATPASRGQAPADAAPSAGAVAGPDDIDAIALTRYKVVHSHDSMFHRFAVVAGDGKQQLYLGRETECQNMTRKFAGAFLDGAFYQSQIAAAPTPAAQAADSVQEDAARLDYLHSTGSTIEMLPGEVDFYPMRFRVGGLHSAVSPKLRDAIDIARKQGGAT